MEFPLFRDPAGYLSLREGRFGLKTRLKKWYERRAIDRCLSLTRDINTVCDIPSGPGRLFDYWSARGWKVTGMDLSEEMVWASRARHHILALDGSVQHHNAFDEHPETFDIVASVRFVYYFKRADRIRLIKSLASMSTHYVLLQYKTSETRKGAKNARKSPNANVAYRKYHCTRKEISDEISEAGLLLRGMEFISQSSDRVFVIAEKLRA